MRLCSARHRLGRLARFTCRLSLACAGLLQLLWLWHPEGPRQPSICLDRDLGVCYFLLTTLGLWLCQICVATNWLATLPPALPSLS